MEVGERLPPPGTMVPPGQLEGGECQGHSSAFQGWGWGRNKGRSVGSRWYPSPPAYLFPWTLFKREEVGTVRVDRRAIRWQRLELYLPFRKRGSHGGWRLREESDGPHFDLTFTVL